MTQISNDPVYYTIEEIAEKAYKTFLQSIEQVNPRWQGQTDLIRAAWQQSCLKVIELGQRGYIDMQTNTPGEIDLFKDEN